MKLGAKRIGREGEERDLDVVSADKESAMACNASDSIPLWQNRSLSDEAVQHKQQCKRSLDQTR